MYVCICSTRRSVRRGCTHPTAPRKSCSTGHGVYAVISTLQYHMLNKTPVSEQELTSFTTVKCNNKRIKKTTTWLSLINKPFYNGGEIAVEEEE